MKAYDEQSRRPGLMEILQKSEVSGLADVLHNLDDETLRKIFKMPPQLTADHLQHNKGEVVDHDQPPLMENDPRRDKRETADRPSQMNEDQRESVDADVSILISRLGIP